MPISVHIVNVSLTVPWVGWSVIMGNRLQRILILSVILFLLGNNSDIYNHVLATQAMARTSSATTQTLLAPPNLKWPWRGDVEKDTIY
jgi:hypothetical protein